MLPNQTVTPFVPEAASTVFSPESARPLIDWDQLHHLSDGNKEFELELLQMFIHDAENQLRTLEAAIASSDFDSIEHAAHQIKGAGANIGLTSIAAIGDRLEQQAHQHQLVSVTAQITHLKQLLNELRLLLRTDTASG